MHNAMILARQRHDPRSDRRLLKIGPSARDFHHRTMLQPTTAKAVDRRMLAQPMSRVWTRRITPQQNNTAHEAHAPNPPSPKTFLAASTSARGWRQRNRPGDKSTARAEDAARGCWRRRPAQQQHEAVRCKGVSHGVRGDIVCGACVGDYL